MDIYDYSKQRDLESEILTVLERMPYPEMRKMLSATETISSENENKERKQKEIWYKKVLLPILKEFAENEGLILEVSGEGTLYTAVIKSDFSIDILQSCAGVRLALLLSECIEIRKEETCCLTLIHDCETLPEWPLDMDEDDRP